MFKGKVHKKPIYRGELPIKLWGEEGWTGCTVSRFKGKGEQGGG